MATSKPLSSRDTKARRPRKVSDAATARQVLLGAGYPREHDVLLISPINFVDETKVTKLIDAPDAEPFLAEVEILEQRNRQLGKARLLECKAADDTGSFLIHYVNPPPWLRSLLAEEKTIRLLGKITRKFDPMLNSSLRQPMLQPLIYRAGAPLKTHLTARYGTINKVNIANLARLVDRQLAELSSVPDPIPPSLRKETSTLPTKESMRVWHQPRPAEMETRRHLALHSLKFDEWLAHILLQRRDRIRFKKATVPPIPSRGDDFEVFAAQFPFDLSESQLGAMRQISKDLGEPSAMRRLVHGDVGCGKTVVAAFACWLTARAGQTAAFMCPTVILAHQHYERLKSIFKALGVSCHLLVSSLKASERRNALVQIKIQQNCVVVGTHALLQKSVSLPALRLAVIDEQHRFGVAQSKSLASKGKGANVLLMSATPIPRTLELGMLSQIDMTRMKDRPMRSEIRTLVASSTKAGEVLEKIISKDMQTYWICPMIKKGATNLRAAEDEYARIKMLMPDLKPSLIHGRMGDAEKLEAMSSFENGDTRLLVATTVVEVGVDAPEADMIVIDHAERLGLSQLHQLRGRVGRGGKIGYCVLLYEPDLSETAKRRLQVMHESNDGFEIAAVDLELRGPGDIIGKRQSGARKYHFADYLEDQEVLEQAQVAADKLLVCDEESAKRHAQFWLVGKVPKAQGAS